MRLPCGAAQFLDELLSVVLPRACPLCRAVPVGRNDGFCPSCLRSFESFRPPFCSRCGAPLPEAEEDVELWCPECLTETVPALPNVAVRALGPYSGALRDAILGLKYGGRVLLARPLGRLLADRFRELFPAASFDLLLPVPLHPARLRDREFNQSVLLAGPLSERTGFPVELHAVLRARDTPSQSLFTGAKRRRNLRQAFAVRDREAIRGKSILIVDDVCTTGATVRELARILLASGASMVAAVTLAKSLASGRPGRPARRTDDERPTRPGENPSHRSTHSP
ncbi:MAG: ComF family protein [bacterium]